MLINIKEYLCYHFKYKFKKDSIMLKKLLVMLLLISSLSYAETMVSENSNLKLQLQVYELQAQIQHLHKIIDELQTTQQQEIVDKQAKIEAIAILKSDLHKGKSGGSLDQILLLNQ